MNVLLTLFVICLFYCDVRHLMDKIFVTTLVFSQRTNNLKTSEQSGNKTLTKGLLIGSLMVDVEASELKRLADYVENNIRRNKADHLVFFLHKSEKKSIELMEDRMVRRCYVVVNSPFGIRSSELVFLDRNLPNPLWFLVGSTIEICDFFSLPRSEVKIDAKGPYTLYVLCHSFVHQSWKLLENYDPYRPVLDLQETIIYKFEVRVEASGQKISTTLQCETIKNWKGEMIVDKVSGDVFFFKIISTGFIICYVNLKMDKKRYYPHIITVSWRTIRFHNPTKLFYTNNSRRAFKKMVVKYYTFVSYPFVAVENPHDIQFDSIHDKNISVQTCYVYIYVTKKIPLHTVTQFELYFMLHTGKPVEIFFYIINDKATPDDRYEVDVDENNDESFIYLNKHFSTTEYFYIDNDKSTSDPSLSGVVGKRLSTLYKLLVLFVAVCLLRKSSTHLEV